MAKATLVNSTGQKIVVDAGSAQANQYFRQGYKLMGGAPKPVVNNTPKPIVPAPVDPLAGMAKQFGAGGATFQDFITSANGQNAVTQGEKDKVYGDLGITDLESKSFALPTQSTEGLYNAKYSELGLQGIKDKITALNDQITSKKDQLNQATGAVNENPWLSEASRIGRNKRLQDLSSADINNLIDQHTNLSDLYNSGITELNNHVARASQDFQNDATTNTNKLNYLLKKAESQIGDIQTAKNAKVYRYATDYFNSSADKDLISKGYTPIANPTQLKGLQESDLMRLGSKIYKKPASETVKSLMTKYPDAGITSQDSEATANAKLKTSAIYQKETDTGKTTYGIIGQNADGTNIYGFIDTGNKKVTQTGGGANSAGIVSTPNGETYDIASYATDPTHEAKIQGIMNNMGQMKTVQSMDTYIQRVAPGSKVTGQMIANSASKYGVSWEVMMAIMQQDSSFGTAGKGARTMNPGNVGNTDSGATVAHASWQAGVDAVAKNLAWRKQAGADKPADNEYIKALVADPKTKISDIKGKNTTETAALVKAFVTEKARIGAISPADAEQTAQLNDKVTLIDSLIKGLKGTFGAGSGVVGPTALAQWSGWSHLNGAEQEFVGGVRQLTNKDTMDTLVNLKKAGGTLGALSDGERVMLQQAASKINGWEVRDDKGTGQGIWNISESAFTKELEQIKLLTQRAIKNAGGPSGIVSTLEQKLAANTGKIAEYNTLVAANPNLSDEEILQALGL